MCSSTFKKLRLSTQLNSELTTRRRGKAPPWRRLCGSCCCPPLPPYPYGTPRQLPAPSPRSSQHHLPDPVASLSISRSRPALFLSCRRQCLQPPQVRSPCLGF